MCEINSLDRSLTPFAPTAEYKYLFCVAVREECDAEEDTARVRNLTGRINEHDTKGIELETSFRYQTRTTLPDAACSF
jgi:hypothetical protein